jgi:hypothetical protein
MTSATRQSRRHGLNAEVAGVLHTDVLGPACSDGAHGHPSARQGASTSKPNLRCTNQPRSIIVSTTELGFIQLCATCAAVDREPASWSSADE